MDRKCKFLIVEDEPMIAMILGDYLGQLGHEVAASVDTVDKALAALDSPAGANPEIDGAIVDIRLGKDVYGWPVVERLSEVGIPYILSSGDSAQIIPHDLETAPVLPKPYSIDDLSHVLSMLYNDN